MRDLTGSTTPGTLQNLYPFLWLRRESLLFTVLGRFRGDETAEIVGAGWLKSELADHGVVFRPRFRLLKEQLRAIKEIWTTNKSAFHGQFVSFDKMPAFPTPLQRPHPPIIIGEPGERAIQVTAELCNGWAPWLMERTETKETIGKLRERAAANGRDPNSLEGSQFERNIPDTATLAEMERAGVKRIILTIFGQRRDEALPRLDGLAKVNR